MKVLVAGASGFLGLAAVRSFAASGHEVLGLVRSPERGTVVKRAGGTPITGDIMSTSGLAEVARGCDVLIHLATTENPGGPRTMGQSLTAKVRVDGAFNLIAAARASRVRRLIVGSGYWVWPDTPGAITESTPVSPMGEPLYNWHAERAALDAWRVGHVESVVVRPGMVYGPGSWLADMVDSMKRGTYRVIGDGANHWSCIHLDDCGEAFRAAAERGKPGEVYLAVDEAPVPWREVADFIADEIGAPRPPSIGRAEAVAQRGETLVRLQTANRAASNAKLKGIGWFPRYPQWREGLAQVLREMAKGSG